MTTRLYTSRSQRVRLLLKKTDKHTVMLIMSPTTVESCTLPGLEEVYYWIYDDRTLQAALRTIRRFYNKTVILYVVDNTEGSREIFSPNRR